MTLSIYKRASGVICTTGSAADTLLGWRPDLQVDVINEVSRAGAADFETLGNRIAADHMLLYRRAADRSRVPAVLL